MSLKTPIKPRIRDQEFGPGTEAFNEQNAARQSMMKDNTVDQNLTALGRVTTGHVKKWDPITATNLANLERNQMHNPAKRAWVIVLHPWPVSVNGGRMMRETAPPAGIELFSDNGDLLIHRHRIQGEGALEEHGHKGVGVLQLPWYEPDMKPEENGSYSASAILPIEQAGEYMREGNSNDLWGPGVMIYDGDVTPDEAYQKNIDVSLFDPHGRPQLRQEVTKVQRRGIRNPVEDLVDVPVVGKFRDVFKALNEQRISRYLPIVNEANAYYVSSEGKEKKWYTSRTTIFMAQVLFKLKHIKTLPDWAMDSDLTATPDVEHCKNCGTDRNKSAAVCVQCGWPFDAFEAYMADPPHVAFEHIAVQNLPIEKLKKALAKKTERDKKRDMVLAGASK